MKGENSMDGSQNENTSVFHLEDILARAKEHGASDVHFAPGSPVILRVNGQLLHLDDVTLMPEDIDPLVRQLLRQDQLEELAERGELDLSHTIRQFGRMRVNVFRQRGTYAMAIRLLSFDVPTVDELHLPETVVSMAHEKRGLILVTGATGSGKSTTLAALIHLINKTYAKHIITLEDPIEYLHRHQKSMVTQREIGLDSNSYADALRAALRQDPDVILVGEMRDLETISTAITAAETGHLVFSTLHTKDAASAIDRIIDVFPPHQQQQIRIQLAGVLEGVVAQQLLPCVNADGNTVNRIAAFEVMVANTAIRNLIREGKTFQIPGVMQTGKKEGMVLMDDAIFGLYKEGKIASDTAISFALDPIVMQRKMQGI